jgi:2-dehydro-3-deoxyphosphogluconate aldolase/(4S)-4-hydroxy-2-oxoglutarate aldolase
MENAESILGSARVIPIVSFDDAATAVPTVRALIAGGLNVLELVLRTPAALTAMRAIHDEFGDSVTIAAGTVLNVTDMNASVAAGAAVVISPGLTPALLAAARSYSVPYLPAIATASDVMLGLDHGYRYFKFFPAANLGPGTLKALAGPFADVRFCANGGITRENAAEFLALTNVKAVGVSWVAPPGLIAQQNWQAIRENAGWAAKL